MKNLTKIVRVGTVKEYGNPKAGLYCKAKIKDGKLSVTGVIGPRSGGNTSGGCGQIDMDFAHRNPADDDRRTSKPTKPEEITFAAGWTADLWLDFLDIWHKWHRNDMRANCEHQVGPEWTPKDVTLYHFRLTDEASRIQDKAKDAALRALKTGEPFTPTSEQTFLAMLDYSLTCPEPNPPAKLELYYQPAHPLYPGAKSATETKATNWLRPGEHPEGYLGKPCPVCGYKYGSEWRREELPQSVYDFIAGLPDADTKPAWV